MNDAPGTAGKRSRAYDWQDPDIVAGEAQALTGMEFLAKIRSRELQAPIQETLDFRLDDFGEGWSTWTLYLAEYQYNPAGLVHGGVITTVLDSAMGVSLWTTLPRGSFGTTVELKVNFVRPVVKESGPLRCEAKVIHSGRTIGTAEGQMLDQAGKLVAHGTTTCMAMFPRRPGS